MANIKIDFHTHSSASHDGGISLDQYQKIFNENTLDCVAVTDHGTIRLAQELKKTFGEKIIVGEEILANEGEVIGLFLEKPVPDGLPVNKTINLIKEQGGIVYIPHPFETVRKGLSQKTLESVVDDIDLIETCNGRAFLQNRSEQTVLWARLHHIPGVASSDAHGLKGIGKTYTLLSGTPTRETVSSLVKTARLITDRPRIRALLYPAYHRTRKKVLRS